VFVAVALSLSPRPEAALAHGQASFRAPVLRPAFVHNRGFPADPRNAGRQSWNWRNGGGQSWAWRGRYGGSRYGRNGWFLNQGRNSWTWNQGQSYGGDFWYPPYGYEGASASPSPGPGGALIIAVGAPSEGNFPAFAAQTADPNEGGCVIHRLLYDGSGSYLGERQIPEC